jgi:hypothetical protein
MAGFPHTTAEGDGDDHFASMLAEVGGSSVLLD